MKLDLEIGFYFVVQLLKSPVIGLVLRECKDKESINEYPSQSAAPRWATPGKRAVAFPAKLRANARRRVEAQCLVRRNGVGDGSRFDFRFVLKKFLERRNGSDHQQVEGGYRARVFQGPRLGAVDVLEVRSSRTVLFFLFFLESQNFFGGLWLMLGEPLIRIT